MSFSVIAKGNKADTLRSLGYQQVAGVIGASTMATLHAVLAPAPADLGGREVLYTVEASGHGDVLGESVPYLIVKVTGELAPKPEQPAEAPAETTSAWVHTGTTEPVTLDAPSAPAAAEHTPY